jgi:hypothetical protein
MQEFREKLKEWWNWFKSLFITYYKLDVSYNHTWGDADDQSFVVKKFHKKQEKFLSFTTQDGELVEIRGADGLNYRISEL